MNRATDDLRDELREMFLRHEADVLAPASLPTVTRTRVHRRQVRVAVTGALAAAGLLAGSIFGVRAIDASPDLVPLPSGPSQEKAPEDFFVDIRTGEATPLPKSITSIPGSSAYQACPDGTRLAFVTGTGVSEIHVANIDGTGVRRVTRRQAGDALAGSWAPRWSPDGTEIVYVSGYRGGTATEFGVFVLDVATRGTTQMTAEDAWQPSFSQDGRTILFTAHDGKAPALWTVARAGGEPKVLLPNAANGSFSPDGTTIAFHRAANSDPLDLFLNFEVRLAPVGGGRHRSLGRSAWTDSPTIPGEWWESTRPMWSPDGTQIVQERVEPGGTREILVVDVATGEITSVGFGRQPTWFDDDTLIVEAYSQEA